MVSEILRELRGLPGGEGLGRRESSVHFSGGKMRLRQGGGGLGVRFSVDKIKRGVGSLEALLKGGWRVRGVLWEWLGKTPIIKPLTGFS